MFIGPLLLLIFINDLGDEANYNVYLFADDVIHTHALHTLIASQPNIQTDIDDILRWGTNGQLHTAKLKLNT
jgi:hypothetical protein